MRFKIHKLFDDPTEGRIINNRLFNGVFQIIQYSVIPEKEKENLIHLLCLICKKLISVKKHFDSYKVHEAKAIEHFTNSKIVNEIWNEVELSDDLFLEFDGFLVQVKSTLDYLVRVPSYILGKRYWSLGSFGDKGARVSRAIKNLPKEHQSRAKGFDVYLIDMQKNWLEDTIHARDKINHLTDGGVDYRLFCVSTSMKQDVINVPMWSPDQTISDFMLIVWRNLFRYCEDFIALFLSLKLPPELSVVKDNDNFPEPVNPWKVVATERFEEMLKYRNIPMDLIVK